jgi:transposase-like protein
VRNTKREGIIAEIVRLHDGDKLSYQMIADKLRERGIADISKSSVRNLCNEQFRALNPYQETPHGAKVI